MATSLLAALGIMSALWPFHGDSQTVTSRYQTPAWHIDATRDKFTSQMRCRLYQGKRKRPVVAYAHGALAFQFDHKLNTTKAAFAIDSGAVKPWTSVYPDLIGSGASLSARSLDNPTEGKVLIPSAILSGAHLVTIRATPRSKPRKFGIDGFGDALASARNQGCDPITGFTF